MAELAARTIGHAHRVLSRALSDAESDGVVVRNVCKLQRAPKVAESEMVIVQDVPAFVDKIRGERLYVPAIVALFTGMRLGEILALRERRVNLDAGVIEVREALEETQGARNSYSRRRRSKAGRRNITLPDIAVEALREHRKQLLEMRMKLGLGKLAPDDLLFANLEGRPLRPSTVSSDWGDLAERIGMPEITFHASAAHPRLAADRRGRRYRHDHRSALGTPSRASRLRFMPTCFKRRQQGGGGDQRGLESLGGNWVAMFDLCSARHSAKSLTCNGWRGGRVAEGGGLLNRYTV